MKNNKPIIGIPGYMAGDNCFGVPTAYIRYASYFGIPRILTMEEDVDDRISLLIIPGGADVNTLRYGQQPSYFTGKPDPMKEYFDTQILPLYIERRVPIFGICRGIQTLAVHFGAKLIQHMYHSTNVDNRSDKVHPIDLLGDFKTEYETVYGKDRIKVNSMHHQCVSFESFPNELEVLGICPNKPKSHIEVIRHKKLPVYAVQFHPEELVSDSLGDFIIEKLLRYSELQKELEYAKIPYHA